MEVIRELVHLIPSQSSQGSAFFQLGGVFCKLSVRDLSAETAPQEF